MKKCVFISHANQDGAVASALVASLEKRGLPCWVAPRDVPAGSDYADVIPKAVRDSQALVLLITAKAAASEHVTRELELAIQGNLQILPVRLDDSPLPDGFLYRLATVQWIDAHGRSSKASKEHLAETIAGRLLDTEPGEVRPPADQEDTPPSAGVPPASKKHAVPVAGIVAAMVLLLGLALAAGKFFQRSGVEAPNPASAAVTSNDKSGEDAPLNAAEDQQPEPQPEPQSEPKPQPSPETLAAASVDQQAIREDATVDEQVRFIFRERCADCHYPDNDFPDLSQTTNLAQLLKPDAGGETIAAAILDRTTRADDAKGRMPKSAGPVGSPKHTPPLSAAEQSIIRQWADSGKGEAASREPILFTEMVRRIYDDVRKHEKEAPFLRYLTLTNLYNASTADGSAQVDDATLDSHRAGIGKLINSLSMHGRITFPEAIDEQRTIYRIDLRDYKWSAADWERVVNFYPHAMIGIDRQKENLIAEQTGSRMAYLRADWFVFAAAQPPLYDELLVSLLGVDAEPGYKDAADVADVDILSHFEQRLGIDRVKNLQQGDALRAGFHRSGVSEANRLIERHELGSHPGAYWISYDFKRQAADARDNLLRAPLGPPEAGLSDDQNHIFDHDGGEVIFNLPNGLQAYLLTTATGERLARAPIEIVQDNNHPENLIVNGISCIRCHDQGIKAAIRATVPESWNEATQGARPNTLAGMRDEIRTAVSEAGVLDFDERRHLEALYADPDELQAVVLADFERFSAAEAKATGGLRGALEPVAGLYEEYQRMVDARRLSSELGMPHQEVLALLKEERHASESISVLYNWLDKGQAERRETLLQDYLSLVYALGFELQAFEPLGYEDFGGAAFAELIRESDSFVAAFGSGSTPTRQNYADTKAAVLTSSGAKVNLTRDTVLLPGGGKLQVTIQPKLVVGDSAELVVSASEAVHLRIIHLSSDEHVTELFPGSTGQDTLLAKDKDRVVSWTTTAPGGPEHVVVYASSQPISNTTAGAQTVGDFAIYQRDEYFSTRGIPKNIKAGDVSAGSARPADIVEARVAYVLEE